jgi:hypothetical protein
VFTNNLKLRDSLSTNKCLNATAFVTPVTDLPGHHSTTFGRKHGCLEGSGPSKFLTGGDPGPPAVLQAQAPLVLAKPSLETQTSGPAAESISDSVTQLLQKGAIEPAPNNLGFYSHLFNVPKKDGSL